MKNENVLYKELQLADQVLETMWLFSLPVAEVLLIAPYSFFYFFIFVCMYEMIGNLDAYSREVEFGRIGSTLPEWWMVSVLFV